MSLAPPLFAVGRVHSTTQRQHDKTRRHVTLKDSQEDYCLWQETFCFVLQLITCTSLLESQAIHPYKPAPLFLSNWVQPHWSCIMRRVLATHYRLPASQPGCLPLACYPPVFEHSSILVKEAEPKRYVAGRLIISRVWKSLTEGGGR